MLPHSEPTLVTAPDLVGVLGELRAREPIFHHRELGTTRADFENMMTPDFWEVGASGRRYSRDSILDELERRYAGEYVEGPMEATDFHCRKLADEVYLLTYTLFQGERKTRRATVWQRIAGDWKIVFHQGTIVQGEGAR
jgi:hypothetical protein